MERNQRIGLEIPRKKNRMIIGKAGFMPAFFVCKTEKRVPLSRDNTLFLLLSI